MLNRFRHKAHRFYDVLKNKGIKYAVYKVWEKTRHKLKVEPVIPLPTTPSDQFPSLRHKKAVYVFPVIDWAFRMQRPQQIAKEFVKAGEVVIYFTTTFTHSHKPGFQLTQHSDHVLLVSLHLNKYKNIYKEKLTKPNLDFLLKSIASLEQHLSVNKKIAIIDHPFWFPLAEKLSGAFTIYDCMDYHPGFGDASAYLVELEEQAMTKSNLLVLTSQDLYQRFAYKNRQSVLIRNGCEFDYFNKAVNEVYQSSYEKVIGYYGAIASWFDVETLVALADLFPNYEWLLVGSTYDCNGIEQLNARANITLIGEVEYNRLTYFLYAFDVAIMPFMVNELTLATNPVKVYEYLSAGVPVVSTRLPEVELMGDVVFTATSVPEFTQAISTALSSNTLSERQKRIAFAQQNDWTHRYKQLTQYIEKAHQTLPKVSIVLVTYNNLAFTQSCLYSMEQFNNYANCEIIVVDNLSTDGTRAFLTEYEQHHAHFKAILHSSNSGFAAGNNIGIQAATGDVVILLNNDTYVTPNWIHNLIKHFETDEKIAMVGPRTNNIGNEAKHHCHYSDMEQMVQLATELYYHHQSAQYEIDVLAFFCVAIKRSIIEQVGLLDEVYGIGMFEDDDYCMRVKQKGYRLICADDVFIHHHLSASFDKDPEWKRKLFEKNKAIYEAKWGTWRGHSYR